MSNFSSVLKTAACLLLIGGLAACGSDSTVEPTPVVAAPVPTTFAVSGTAATGAALDGATITITGSDGTTYPAAGEPAVVTGTDGSYTITLPLSAKPPFVVTAVKNDVSLVSVVAEAKDTTANVTPVTNLIASRLSSSGDPSKLAAEILADPTLVDLAKVTAKVAEVVALIKPVMDAAGTTANPLTGNIKLDVAAGTGADKVLDSLSINITPSSATTVNIEVAVKQKLAEGADPNTVTFSGGAGATAPAALATVAAESLVPSGNAALIADLLQRLTACYATAPADRIVSGGTTAADIVATACKDIFVGNDPASYLSNGSKVGAKGSFSGIFSSATGVKFENGIYEFTRGNGDLVIRYKATDSSGNASYQNLAVRADTDGKLRAIGNQYKYNGAVNAYQQVRNFINQTAADYYSTGYNLQVSNTADVADIGRVVVTSPKGNTLLLKPSGGSAYFVLVKVDSTTSAQTLTGTNFVRLAREYADTANTGDPALADTGNFFSSARYAEADIVAIPAQKRWKFDYYLKTNTSATPNETQYFTTRARAMTIAELKAQPLAKLTDAEVASIKSAIVTASNGSSYVPADTTSPAELAWEVPTGALEPTSIQVYGRGPAYTPAGATAATRDSFNDKSGVKSSARSGAIYCSAGANESPSHCNGANYAADVRFTGVHLWAEDADGRDFAHFYATYTVTIP